MVTFELFQISVFESPVQPNEAWGWETGSPNSVGMKKFELHHASCGLLGTCSVYSVFTQLMPRIGTIYMDLFHRPRKINQAAHLTIQTGCVNTRSVLRPDFSHSRERQLPIVALLLNFHSPSSSSTQSNPCLSLKNLETLYHEWGHALHSLLSHTTFQHLSGTRGGVDYVEIPSHLFEHFSREPSVVASWARHVTSGARIPSGVPLQTLQ